MTKKQIIAAVRNDEDFAVALESKVGIIFHLAPNIETVTPMTELAHKAGKKLFIHLDLAEGIGKDEAGIKFAKKQGVDGIISTRSGIVKMAKNAGVFTVQRFFIVDSQSVETTVQSVKSSKADMIEVMPGTVYKIIAGIKEKTGVPVVAGGLIETVEEAENAIKNGAAAVSTGKKELWG